MQEPATFKSTVLAGTERFRVPDPTPFSVVEDSGLLFDVEQPARVNAATVNVAATANAVLPMSTTTVLIISESGVVRKKTETLDEVFVFQQQDTNLDAIYMITQTLPTE